MGWTSLRMKEPVKEWFKNHVECNGKYTVLDSALVKRKVLYGAIKNNQTNEVFCLIFLVSWSKDYDNFAYKDMDETVNPYYYDCPLKIFNLLTDLINQNEYSKEWRKKVLEYHSINKEVKFGKVIQLKEAIQFSNGMSFKFFKKEGRKWVAGTMMDNDFIPFSKVHSFNPLRYVLVN